jgi:regulator of replication initiation timing
MSETSEKVKATRETLNKKLSSQIETIKTYTSTFNEEGTRKRLAAFVTTGVLSVETVEEMIRKQRAHYETKPDGAAMQSLKAEVFSIVNEHFAVDEEVVRERVSLKDALSGLYFKTVRLTPEPAAVLFAVEGYIAEQERKAAEALKKLAAAK